MNRGYLREATEDDILLLYHWANDKEVRKNSFQTHTISIDEHKKWFENKIKSVNCNIYIFMVNNIPIGQIRLDYEGNKATIDYNLDKNYRGQGYGKILIDLAEQKVKETKKEIVYLLGEVKKKNIPSRKIFSDLKYEEIEVIKYLKRIC